MIVYGLPFIATELADYGFVGTEPAAPAVEAQHGDRMRSRHLVVICTDDAAANGTDPEHVEICTGDKLAIDSFRAVADAEVHGATESREHAREDIVVLSKVQEHRIRNLGAISSSRAVERPSMRTSASSCGRSTGNGRSST